MAKVPFPDLLCVRRMESISEREAVAGLMNDEIEFIEEVKDLNVYRILLECFGLVINSIQF